ncbi:activator of Hsp90 ATPase [Scheffersomyces amazonensis]|uniref:activator of Hsp90 ATPase n=1 Tax=Scheffersomyces amazonensis TaxID=1078765 RepID=UPI00315DE8F2
MVVHNPNNWHWIDKNCLPWTKEYLDREIKDTVIENEGYKFTVISIDSVTGDCDVTQRKGKVLCIYDLALQFGITIQDSEQETFNGTISLPEFVHDQDDDEYIFEVTSDNKASEIKKFFLPELKVKLQKFQGDLIDAHAKDVQHASN